MQKEARKLSLDEQIARAEGKLPPPQKRKKAGNDDGPDPVPAHPGTAQEEKEMER